MIKERKSIKAQSKTEVTLRDCDNVFRKSGIWVESNNFYGVSEENNSDAYLIIGFDTEYKSPDNPVTNADIRAKKANNKILSYQVHCSLYDPSQPEAVEWSGICYPNGDVRLSLADIVTFAIWKGISTEAVRKLPAQIYMVGHFTRADIPAFSDFQSLTEVMSSVRSTFLSIGHHIPLIIEMPGECPISLKITLRDTMLLTPATSKSLRALGELVGIPKISLDPDPTKEQFYKTNMDILLRERPEAFEEYAINDAIICVRYLEKLIDQYETIMGVRKVPATLTSIGVDLLLDTWKVDPKVDPLELMGQERIVRKFFSKRLNRYVKKPEIVDLQEVAWYKALATECYHGGRNEQFWFGPAFEDNWTDYDLAGAYPTAMAILGAPDWRNARVTTVLSDFSHTTLGIAHVEFEFPKSVRFPTLPVRTGNGLVFPHKGVSDCAAPEITLARSLGAKLKIRYGVVIPTDANRSVFGEFIKSCITKRMSYPKGSLDALFWKELSNSSYGKTAQGLHYKRVYDLRDREMKPLPPSKITNPYFAAFITSFVRATLGEIINGLTAEVCVFSCTTDGFLTNATASQITEASSGPLSEFYRQSRQKLTNDSTMLEVKHQVRQPLGWRTRGQATLKEGLTDKGDGVNIVLAKGGIYTDYHLDDVRLQNDYIVNLFLKREPHDQIPMTVKTGIRDIVEFEADLVEKQISKTLNMEFDWKRRPVAVWEDRGTGHVAFATEAWDTIDQFAKMREYWEAYGIVTRKCTKTVEDYREFAIYVFSQSSLTKAQSRYLKKKNPDLSRLRQSLCAAWQKSQAGLSKYRHGKSAQAFAFSLIDAGIPCKVTDIENARKPFSPNNCPASPEVITALEKLQVAYPTLKVEEFLSTGVGINLIKAIGNRCPFVSIAEQ
jgi:hypothetical protein